MIKVKVTIEAESLDFLDEVETIKSLQNLGDDIVWDLEDPAFTYDGKKYVFNYEADYESFSGEFDIEDNE